MKEDTNVLLAILTDDNRTCELRPEFVVQTRTHRVIRALLYAITGDVNEIFDHIRIQGAFGASKPVTFVGMSMSMSRKFELPIDCQNEDSFIVSTRLQMPLKTEEPPKPIKQKWSWPKSHFRV
jgi:hypothetical protein